MLHEKLGLKFTVVKAPGQLISLALLILILTGCQDIERWVSRLPRRPSASPSLSTPSPAPAQSPETSQMETQIVEQINAIRQQQGRETLRVNPKLAEVARRYSQQMAEQHFFSHTSPKGDRVGERVHAAGIFYLVVGENLFTSTNIPQPVSAAVQGWMDSPGHRENILRSEYRETGVGVWQQDNSYYITQLFLRSVL